MFIYIFFFRVFTFVYACAKTIIIGKYHISFNFDLQKRQDSIHQSKIKP